MNIVIIGKGLMLANIVLGAIDSGAKIVGVLRYESICNSRLKQMFCDFLNPSYEYTLLKQYNIPILNFDSANSDKFRNFLITNNVDILFVGTWKERLKKEIFDIPTIGTINIHPSLLPKYRGPNPYLQTIINGEEFSGVTLHLIDSNYDTGAILLQERLKIDTNETSKELKEKSVLLARKLVSSLLSQLKTHIVTPVCQKEDISSYYSNISGDEKMLDFENQSSIEIFRTVKALHPFLPTYITYKNSFFVVDPYSIEIVDFIDDGFAGKIIDKSIKDKSLTIVCKDSKAIKFKGLSLYKGAIFTKLFIKYFVNLNKK